MRGLDPRIHEAVQRLKPYGCHPLHFIMDCRVKPGNDTWRIYRRSVTRSVLVDLWDAHRRDELLPPPAVGGEVWDKLRCRLKSTAMPSLASLSRKAWSASAAASSLSRRATTAAGRP